MAYVDEDFDDLEEYDEDSIYEEELYESEKYEDEDEYLAQQRYEMIADL